MMKFVERPRKQPDFPEFKSQGGLMGLLAFILSILLWIGLIIVFAFTIYTNWFRKSLQSIFHFFGYETRQIPFLIAGLMSFFLFPATIVVIVLGYIFKK